MASVEEAVVRLDADVVPRLNRHLRDLVDAGTREIVVENPRSRHNLGVGQHGPVTIRFEGSTGYYTGGLNDGADIVVERNVGWGLGEAQARGSITVHGSAALGTGASMRGGTIVVHGNCGPRTAAGMKGGTLIVVGSVGYLAGFMTHDGDLIVCGDAGEALGDSMWAGRIYVAGTIRGLGADAQVARARRRGPGPRARPAARPGDRRRVPVQAGQGRREALVLRQARSGGVAQGMSGRERTPRRITPTAARTCGRPRRSATSRPRADLGRYQIRGFSTFHRFPTLDDLVFLPAVMTRLPLEGYREAARRRRSSAAAGPTSSRGR